MPSREEIAHCSGWLDAEFDLLRPRLLIPVGRLAIGKFMKVKRLEDVVGCQHVIRIHRRDVDVVPLPHPSGRSSWHRVEPGLTLLDDALGLIRQHPAWRSITEAA